VTTVLAVAAQFLLAAAFSLVMVLASRRLPRGWAFLASTAAFVAWLVANRALVGEGGWYGVIAVLAGILVVQVPAYRHEHARRAGAADRDYRDRLAADGDSAHPTAESAALARLDAADVRVVETKPVGPATADVVVEVGDASRVTVRCERVDSGWLWTEVIDDGSMPLA
jgi:hypothetical protein